MKDDLYSFVLTLMKLPSYGSSIGVSFFFFFFFGVLGLCCCTRAFSSCGEWGLLFIVVRRLLTVVASLVAEHGL